MFSHVLPAVCWKGSSPGLWRLSLEHRICYRDKSERACNTAHVHADRQQKLTPVEIQQSHEQNQKLA